MWVVQQEWKPLQTEYTHDNSSMLTLCLLFYAQVMFNLWLYHWNSLLPVDKRIVMSHVIWNLQNVYIHDNTANFCNLYNTFIAQTKTLAVLKMQETSQYRQVLYLGGNYNTQNTSLAQYFDWVSWQADCIIRNTATTNTDTYGISSARIYDNSNLL